MINAMAYLLASILLTLGAAVAPLAELERAQLETATDRTGRLDEGALYPLLRDVLTWAADVRAGALLPDYDALLAEPATYRGQAFFIEGDFAGRPRRFGLARSGPWGDALTEWVLKVGPHEDDVAVVYFVDPDATLAKPRLGQRVQVVGRFYKVWADRDMNNQPAEYLTFIARWPSFPGGPDATAPSTGRGQVLFLLVLLAGVVWFMVRRLRKMSLKPRPLGGRLHRAGDEDAHTREHHIADADEPAQADDQPALPKDPADALDALARKREQGDPPTESR